MKLIFILSAFIFNNILVAQVPTKQHYLDVYKRGLKYNDTKLAINALQNYLAISDDGVYKDTLSMLYFIANDYIPSLLLSQEIMEADKKNIGALERIANCYYQLGDIKSAVTNFEKLCPTTKNPYHHYQLALAQYQLKRTAECLQNLQIVIADSSSKKIATPFSIGEGQVQKVSILAAAYNMAGVMEMEVKNYAKATQYFDMAIQAFPDFVGAFQNKEEVTKLTNAKPQTKPKTTKKPS